MGESVREPLRYYDNNVAGTLTLLGAMQAAQVRSLVFSSSATVYGEPASLPIREDFPLSATNPWLEQAHGGADAGRRGCRRARPVAHCAAALLQPRGRARERPDRRTRAMCPTTCCPMWRRWRPAARAPECVRQRLPHTDGTGVRDYIHVCDLADGHVAALRYLQQHPGLLTVNLGTGRPVSVLEMVRGFEQASGRPVPYQVVARRPGDVAACWADPALAERLLGWKAHHGVERMCQDAWRWQDGVARSLYTPLMLFFNSYQRFMVLSFNIKIS